MKLYAPGNYDAEALSLDTGLECNDPSLAQQHMRDETDINEIVRRFGLTGELPEAVRRPTYGDFTGVFDYQSALNAVRAADEAFAEMPADVRARFGNDAAAFVEFCSDPSNAEEFKKLGLTNGGEDAIRPDQQSESAVGSEG